MPPFPLGPLPPYPWGMTTGTHLGIGVSALALAVMASVAPLPAEEIIE